MSKEKALVKTETAVVVSTPFDLVSQAIEKNVDPAQLEKLLDLQERWEKTQAKKSFLTAMSNFQNEVPEIIKGKKVNFPSKSGGKVEFDYATLPQIKKAIKPYLQKNNLTIRYEYEEKESGKIVCWFIVSHIDGHSERTSMEAGKDTSGNKNDIQSIGSTRSYLERYTLRAGLGITIDDNDDDGKKSKAGEPEKIPAPESKTNYSAIVKKFNTVLELSTWWNKLSKNEKALAMTAKENRKIEIMKAEKKPFDPTNPLGVE